MKDAQSTYGPLSGGAEALSILTGEPYRTVDRQLARARRRLRAAPNASDAGGLDC